MAADRRAVVNFCMMSGFSKLRRKWNPWEKSVSWKLHITFMRFLEPARTFFAYLYGKMGDRLLEQFFHESTRKNTINIEM